MTAQELRDILQLDLGELIGTYKTTSGKIYPAIRIYPPRVDQSWEITGCEVLIYETPDNTGTIPLIGDKLVNDWWIVKLVQWDESQGLSEIITKIQTYFPRVKVSTKPAIIDTFQTAILSIYAPEMIGKSRCF